MPLKKRHSLLVKINLFLLTSIAIIFTITITVISYGTSKNAFQKADDIASLKARKVAADVKSYLNLAMETTHTLSLTMNTLRKDGQASRDVILALLKKHMENNPNYYAIWTMWEPNAFDGKDKFYANKHNQQHGWFACSYYRKEGQLLRQNFKTKNEPAYLSSDLEYEYEDIYYASAKKNKECILVNPYNYSFTGNNTDLNFMTSTVVPILEGNKFLGVIGTDISLSNLQEMIAQAKIYQSGFAAIISNSNIIVAHPNKTYIEQPIASIFKNASDSLNWSVSKGLIYQYQTISEHSNKEVVRYFSPVLLDKTSTPWSVMIEIPINEIKSESNQMVIKVILIGLLSLLSIFLVIFIIVKSITSPLLKSIQLTHNISLGKLNESIELPQSKDEIGNMSAAFRHLIQKLKLMQQVSEIGYWELNVASNKMEWSDGLFQILGYQSQAFNPTLNDLSKLIHIDDKLAFSQLMLNKTIKVQEKRFKLQTNTGEEKHVTIKYQIINNKNGITQHKIGVIQDVSQLTEKELKLKESEVKFRSIFNSSNDAILLIDMEGQFIDANKIAFERSGMSREELLTSNYRNHIIYNQAHNDQQYQQLLIEGKQGRFEASYINKQGRKIYLEINGRKMQHQGKDALLLISRDISERIMLENEIIQTIIQTEERERGRMAKELHDGVSPILSTIKLYANAIIDSKDETFRQKLINKLIEANDEAIKSIYEISNNLTPHILQNFGLITALKTFIERIEESTSINCQLENNLKERLSEKIEIILYRVIIELLNNTIKHAQASTIKISVIKETYIRVSYSDDGIGFNSTDAIKMKNNMGLSNVGSRLKSLNAELTITSKPGQGMLFTTQLQI